jgi:hypothetical protein
MNIYSFGICFLQSWKKKSFKCIFNSCIIVHYMRQSKCYFRLFIITISLTICKIFITQHPHRVMCPVPRETSFLVWGEQGYLYFQIACSCVCSVDIVAEKLTLTHFLQLHLSYGLDGVCLPMVHMVEAWPLVWWCEVVGSLKDGVQLGAGGSHL